MNDLWKVLLVSFSLSLVLTGSATWAFRRWGLGQRIRDQGPSSHRAKAGTPTGGGVGFTAAAVIATLLFAPRDLYTLSALAVTLGFGLIGLLDDYLKVIRGSSLGLRARYKLLGQVFLASALSFVVLVPLGLGSEVKVPYINHLLPLGGLYVPFAVLVVLGTVNAVNLTDGLDGLAGGTAVIAFVTYFVVALAASLEQLSLFSAAIAAAVAGFLPYNLHPAKIFMGDSGAFALGGALGALALLTKTELLLPVIGGVFVVETLSVIIQVVYFRLTGKRVFRMSPLHHHYELGGMSEAAVVRRFWLMGLVFGLAGFLGLRGFGA